MRKIFSNICILLMVCFSLNVMTEGILISRADAAPMTQAEKAKKAKEKEKAKKAKAKEKAQKAKEKEKTKQAKAREKEQEQKQKEKDKIAAQRAATQEAQEKAAAKQPSQEEVYAKKVAEVQKYNDRVARYMTRDISHRLGVWGQVGYSAIFPKNFSYTAAQTGINAVGFNEAAKGWIGGGAGFGYQLRYKRFLFEVGAELQMYNSKNSLYGDDKKNPLLQRNYPSQVITPSGMTDVEAQYKYANTIDMLRGGYVQIPVLFGMEFLDKQMYFLAGPKVGIGVIHTSELTSDGSVSLRDKELINDLNNMSTHRLTSTSLKSKQDVDFGLNVALSAEIGICLDKYMQPKVENKKKMTGGQRFLQAMHTRLALFAEYGVINIQQSSNVKADAMNMPFSEPVAGMPVGMDNVTMCSSLQTAAAKDAKLNPFMVGVKLTFMWDLPRKNLKPMPMPKEPTPRMMARIVNANTNAPLAGAGVSIINLATQKAVSKTTNGQGYINGRFARGNYQVKVDKLGYYSDSVQYTLARDLQDTLLIALAPVPAPIIYTYCARVYAGDTQMPVEAEVRVNGATDSTVLYAGTTADDGLFVTSLQKGTYMTHIRYAGYMPMDTMTYFEQDTLSFYLTKIKEGIKVKINNLFFATNKTYILPQSEAAMEDLATFLLDNPMVDIRIIGHTDSIGSDRANQILSEGRANSVRANLIKRGVDAARIEAEGRGESQPIDTNSTEEGRANNRRVEFTIISTGGEDIKQIY